MTKNLSQSAQKVQNALLTHGLSCQVVELPASTRTAQEAAAAIGCRVEQIVKSLVFCGKRTKRPILVLASGPNRVDEKRICQLISEPIKKADADFVREHTGFAIGGVPPLGHFERMETLIDQDLLNYQDIWAAAGTPNAVFKLAATDLQTITGGKVTAIKLKV